MQAIVTTSAKYLWALRPFSYLFNVYWSAQQPITVVTDVLPDFELPGNFIIKSPSQNQAVPQEQWSTLLIEFLRSFRDTHFVLLLEDYWLIRTVDHVGVESLGEYSRITRNLLRLDLTDDRQYSGDRKDIGCWGHYDLVETPPESPYQMSLQAAIWNRVLLLDVMRPGLSPWKFELELSPALHERPDLRVIGTRQRPIRYANIFKGGDPSHLREDQLALIPREHLDHLKAERMLPT